MLQCDPQLLFSHLIKTKLSLISPTAQFLPDLFRMLYHIGNLIFVLMMEWHYYNIIAMHGILVMCNWYQVSVSILAPLLASVLASSSVPVSVSVSVLVSVNQRQELYHFWCWMFFCQNQRYWVIVKQLSVYLSFGFSVKVSWKTWFCLPWYYFDFFNKILICCGFTFHYNNLNVLLHF